jgi:hypothetical protein
MVGRVCHSKEANPPPMHARDGSLQYRSARMIQLPNARALSHVKHQTQVSNQARIQIPSRSLPPSTTPKPTISFNDHCFAAWQEVDYKNCKHPGPKLPPSGIVEDMSKDLYPGNSEAGVVLGATSCGGSDGSTPV